MFDWDDANIAHLAEHDVTPAEAEQVIVNHPLDVSYEDRKGEVRFRQIGETFSGRILEIISTERKGLTRVITGYEPSRLLRAAYLKYRTEVAHDGKQSST